MLLEDKVALVAGVGPGLGNEIVLALAREGATVVFGARTEVNLVALADEVHALGAKCSWACTDLTQPEQTAALVDLAVTDFGALDTVVMNGRAQVPNRRIEDADLAEWQETFAVNLFASLTLAKHAIPALRARGGGSILFVNSMIIRKPLVTYGAYASSKAALLSLAQVLAIETGPDRIRVNSLLPGYMDGPSLERYFEHVAETTGTSAAQVRAEAAERTLLRSLPTFEDCADAVVFLASDRARSITGQCLDVNSGEVLA